MADRPATCASCGKRLSRKQWYYRNNQFFCTKRCWKTAAHKAKASGESKEPKAADAKDAKEVNAATEAKAADAKGTKGPDQATTQPAESQPAAPA